MDFKNLFQFLEALNHNNNKQWMDQNRQWYHGVRDGFSAWLDDLDITLAGLDGDYYPTPGKKGINRINNNLMFHPHKPIYKDHFGGGLDKRPGTGDFYIQIGLHESLLAGGRWRPDPKALKSIRDALDYDGEAFKKILDKKSFKDTFGSLYEDEKLTNAPKGFSNDHPHIDLLRHKTFAVVHPLTRAEVLRPDFKEKVIQVYLEMLPFRRYLNKAVMV
jgi:uncharacterized protein (TIGR02453 family)